MGLEIINNGDRITALLSGEIDHHSAADMRVRLENAITIACPRTLILDFSGVTFMDSSGIGLILGRERSLRTIGGKLLIKNTPQPIRKLLVLGGVGGFIIEGGK